MEPRTFRIANLNADTPVPNVRPTYSTYGSMFHPLLVRAAEKIAPNITIKSTEFDTVLGQFPENLTDFDALLVTGSAASSYDDAEWIRVLGRYLKDVYQHHPRIRIFGSCFGHQILCQSLLEDYGAVVEKDPNGWEIGVHEINLDDKFRCLFDSRSKALGGPSTTNRPPTPSHDEAAASEVPSKLRLQFVHADHVRLDPAKLPSSWVSMGSSQHCNVQGLCEPGRVLTYQGHFEFDRFVNSEVLKVFGATWDQKLQDEAQAKIDADDDSAAAAEMVLKFFIADQASPLKAGVETPPVVASGEKVTSVTCSR